MPVFSQGFPATGFSPECLLEDISHLSFSFQTGNNLKLPAGKQFYLLYTYRSSILYVIIRYSNFTTIFPTVNSINSYFNANSCLIMCGLK